MWQSKGKFPFLVAACSLWLTPNAYAQFATSIDNGQTVTLPMDGQDDPYAATLIIGEISTGTLIINDEQLETATAFVGDNNGSLGTVILQHPNANWLNTGNLYFGEDGTAKVSITGGTLSGSNMVLGDQVSGKGIVTLDGANAKLVDDNAIYVGNFGTGVLTVSNGGSVSVTGGFKALALAYEAGSFGTLNIGAAADEAATGAGKLEVDEIGVHDGTGEIVFNHTDDDFRLDAIMSSTNPTTLKQMSGTTILTADSSHLIGQAIISGGKLVVNGKLGSAITVSGGTLAGSGAVAGVTLNSEGAVAPGNSIGTLNTDAIIFNSGSTYRVEAGPGGHVAGVNNDYINSSDTAQINGGDVIVTLEDGDYDLSNIYKILTAANGVTGTFDSVEEDYPFLTPSLSYDANNAYVTLSYGGIGGFGSTPNVKAVSGALGSFTGTIPYKIQIADLTTAEANAAFNQLSGEGTASSASSMSGTNIGTLGNVFSSFLNNDGIGNAGSNASGYAANPQLAAAEPTQNMWGKFYGALGLRAATGTTSATRSVSGGLLAGMDANPHAGETLGIWVSGGGSSYNINNSDVRSADTGIGLYGGLNIGVVRIKAVAGYTRHFINSSRAITFGGLNQNLVANYQGGTLSGMVEISHTMDFGADSLTPFGKLELASTSTDGFTETGGAGALTSSGGTHNSAFTTIGLKASHQLVVDADKLATLTGGIGWRHAFANNPTATNSFSSGNSFVVTGAGPVADTLSLMAGADLNVSDQLTYGLHYDGQIGVGQQSHAVELQVNTRF